MLPIIKSLTRRSRKSGWITFFTIALLSISRPSFAFIACNYIDGASSITASLPLQGVNITVGEDTPNGTIVFRQTIKAPYIPGVTCGASPTAYEYHIDGNFSALPLPLSSWSGSPFSGHVYETGVPGVGVAVWSGLGSSGPQYDSVFPDTISQGAVAAGVSNTWIDRGEIRRFDISLIKIGPISSGSIMGSSLPSVSMDFVIPGNGSMNLLRADFVGALNFVAGTCRTPDVMVNLGKHEVSKKFSGIGSSTEWVKYNITFLDCPVFHGLLNDGNNNYAATDGTFGVGTHSLNEWDVSLSPNTPALDATNGIISLNPNSSSASGIGIQVARISPNNDSGTPAPWDFNQTAVKYYLDHDAISTRIIRFAARYIQTDETVTPGAANSSLSFVINYL